MKMIFKCLIAAVFLGLVAPTFAQDYIILDRRADEFDRWQDRVDWNYGRPVIVREFDVTDVLLEEQRTRTGLGYGGLMIANALARETGRSFDDIVAMKQSGMGWGRIAQENNVRIGPLVSRFDRADNAFRSYGNAKRDQMKSEKFVNGHDARDGRLDKPAKVRGGNGKVKAVGHGGGHGKGKGNGRGHGGGGGKGKGKGGGGGKGKK